MGIVLRSVDMQAVRFIGGRGIEVAAEGVGQETVHLVVGVEFRLGVEDAQEARARFGVVADTVVCPARAARYVAAEVAEGGAVGGAICCVVGRGCAEEAAGWREEALAAGVADGGGEGSRR